MAILEAADTRPEVMKSLHLQTELFFSTMLDLSHTKARFWWDRTNYYGSKLSYLVSNDIKQLVTDRRIKLFLKAKNKNHTYIYFSLISKGSLKNMECV